MKIYQAPTMALSTVNAEDILTLSNGMSGIGETGNFQDWIVEL